MRTWLAFPAAIYAVLLILSAIAAPVSATTSTFTSTADFDAGTKSQPSPADGNFQVETSSDNDGIATGAFELASLKGDKFTLADTDADTFKLDIPANCDTGQTTTRAVTAGVLRISVEKTVGGTNSCGSEYSQTLSVGNADALDARIRLDRTSTTDDLWQFRILNADECRYAGRAGGFDGVMYTIDDLDGNRIYAYTYTNDTFNLIGTIGVPPADPLYLRIAKAASSWDWTWFYSTDGSTWTTDETTTFNLSLHGSTDLRVLACQVNNGGIGTATSADWDELFLSARTFSGGTPFRTSGSWTSATQTPTSEIFTSITVDYSSASGSNYITAVSLISGSGNYRFIDNTDLTSGTTQTYSVQNLEVSGAWTVQVNMTSGGTGTVTVSQVSVVTAIAPSPPPPTALQQVVAFLVGVLPVIVIIIIVVGVIGVIYELLPMKQLERTMERKRR